MAGRAGQGLAFLQLAGISTAAAWHAGGPAEKHRRSGCVDSEGCGIIAGCSRHARQSQPKPRPRSPRQRTHLSGVGENRCRDHRVRVRYRTFLDRAARIHEGAGIRRQHPGAHLLARDGFHGRRSAADPRRAHALSKDQGATRCEHL